METAVKYGKGLLSILALLTLTASLQYYFDIEKNERPLIPPTIIPAQALKVINLGLDSATASLAWLYTIQRAGSQPKELPELIENINDIDPKFSYPYAFGTLVLPDLGFTDRAIKIGELGIASADPDWRIPYYLGVIYHIYRPDRANAIKYFGLASQTPNAPPEVIRVATTYGTAPNLREQTRQIWVSIYETSTDEIVKERALAYIIHINILNMLEEAAQTYKKRFGYYPENLQDLVTKKIIKEVPSSPFGLEYTIDSGRGRVLLKVNLVPH